MSSLWTSKFAIMKDLSVAQGRNVPVAIEGIVAADDKPPALNFPEETDEEFFHHGQSDGLMETGPDLGLIRHMLDMVRDKNISSDEEDNIDKVAAISKLNSPVPEFTATPVLTSTPTPNSATLLRKTKKKTNRNCAVSSLLQAIEDIKNKEEDNIKLKVITDNEPLRLLRPDDFMPSPEVSEAVEKVSGSLDTHTSCFVKSPVQQKSPVKLSLESTNMFKRKSAERITKAIDKSVVKSPSPQNSGTYKPSMLANEYYQKYVERSKLNESIQDDIWTRAETKMKEIDAKKKLEAAKSPTSSSQQESEDSVESLDNFEVKLDKVRLPQHRHLLTGECVVCVVMRENGVISKE